MNNPSDKEILILPKWLQLCHWLWPALCAVWGTIVLGALEVMVKDPNGPVAQWYQSHLSIIVPVGAGLLILTGVVFVGYYIGMQQLALPTSPEQQNRTRFLARLRRRYTDILEQSLQGAAFMALGLVKQMDAVLHTSCLRVRSPSTPERLLPTGTSLLQVYDEANGELLILGDPGTGKTTLLLDLAQGLLARAEQDEQHKFPVIFHLSSWAGKPRQPLSDWLIEELTLRYDVPRRLSQSWVQNEQILPLLDGLDEVALSAREACIHTINTYHKEHLLPLVVCSRKMEYLALHERLSLESTVVVQPLSRQQVDTYLEGAGKRKPLNALRAALRRNPVLYEMTVTPLMLNVLILTYRDMPARSLPKMGTPQAQQQQVFARYVQRMEEPQDGGDSPPQQIQERLIWLAKQMQQHNQTVFSLEQMQPSWLTSKQRQIYEWWALRLPACLIGALLSLATFLVAFGVDTFYLLANSLLGGALGLLLSLNSTTPSRNGGTSHTDTYRYRVVWISGICILCILAGVLLVLAMGHDYQTGLSLSLTKFQPGFWPKDGERCLLIYGLTFGFCGIGLSLTVNNSNRTDQHTSLSPGRNWQKRWQHLTHYAFVRNSLLTGLIVGLSFGLSTGLRTGLDFSGLIYGLPVWGTFGLMWSFIGGFLSVLLAGNVAMSRLIDRIHWSWKKFGHSLFLKKHLSRALLVIILFGLVVGLSTGLIYGLISGLSSGLSVGISMGLIIWLLNGLFQGVESETMDDQRRTIPGQGIRRSGRNGFILGLAGSVVCVLSYIGNRALFDWMSYWISSRISDIGSLDLGSLYDDLYFRLPFGLVFGLTCGVLVTLLKGGLAWYQYGILYLLLWQSGSIPKNYPKFLDEATHRILLRKEGAGYTFIHNLFLDYFANLETSVTSKSISTSIAT